MLTSEILKAAKAEMIQRGWSHGTAVDDRGRVCGVRAIRLATKTDDIPVSLYREASVFAPGKPCHGAESLLVRVATGRPWHVDNNRFAAWNDAPERTEQDIFDAFDASIAIAEQQEASTHIAEPVASPVGV